jgi:hypothetical protein
MTPAHSPAEACNVRKDVIDTFAAKVAWKLGYTAGAALEPIVQRLGGRLTYQSLDDLTRSEASIRIDGPGNFEIFLPDHTSSERDRFSIAHELGHYFLHYPKRQGLMVAQRFGSTRVEWEANWFAAGFLMPAVEFTAVCRAGDLAEAARHFKVSVPAAEARAKALGL